MRGTECRVQGAGFRVLRGYVEGMEGVWRWYGEGMEVVCRGYGEGMEGD